MKTSDKTNTYLYSLVILTLLILMTLFSLEAKAQKISKEGYNLNPYVIGSPDAKVIVTDFSSLTCPYCARYHTQVLPKLLETYKDNSNVRFEFYDFPLDRLAFAASVVSRCNTGSNRKKVIDIFYQNQKKWSSSPNPINELISYVNLFGVTEANVEACIRDQKLLDETNGERTFGAEQYKANSTPSIYVNEVYVKTASYSFISEMIEDALR